MAETPDQEARLAARLVFRKTYGISLIAANVGSLANPYTIAVGNLSLPTALTAYSSSGNISFGKLGGGSAVTAQTTGRIATRED